MLHILADYEQDRRRLASQTWRLDNSRRALLHILQDSHQDKLRLEASRKAMIHIMGDLRETTTEMQRRVEAYLASHANIVSLVTTIGIPLLRADGRLTRGPRINIPPAPPDHAASPIDCDSIEKYARTGWVDLRRQNFELWNERLVRLAQSRPDIASQGSAAFDVTKYSGDRFVPGDVVGWLLTNEVDEQGMVGRRLF